jgi:hypothetical protein
MTTKKFSELASVIRANEVRRRHLAAHKQELLDELALTELRQARQVTQAELARSLNTTQSAISRLEHQTDLYLSTLRSYIEALGGRLEIYADFPDARLQIKAFGDLEENEAAATPSRVTR